MHISLTSIFMPPTNVILKAQGLLCASIPQTTACCHVPPPRSMSAKGHMAYYGCDKCTQLGFHAGRMTFPETEAALRTDASFASQCQEEHHTGTSPFCRLGIGMVTQFPIDYMHLVLLGVVRKFAKYWAKGPYSVRCSADLLKIINARIALVRQWTPCDFSRKLRGLCDRERWKATEARQFLLYVCPVVLKGILKEAPFEHS